jgi:hypothetical protein
VGVLLVSFAMPISHMPWFDELLARRARPGGVYAPMRYALNRRDDDLFMAIDVALRASELSAVWGVWSDSSRTTAERAFSLVEYDARYAHVHLLVADLSARDDDAHAEPFPELREALRKVAPQLWERYAALLVEFKSDFDCNLEPQVHKRGFLPRR